MVTKEGKHDQPWQPSFIHPLSNIVPLLRQDIMNTVTPILVPLFMERQEKELCAFAARKYKHSDPECCACTTRQDFLPLQQDKIKTYLPIQLENMNTTTQNFVPLQQDKTKTFVCLRQKNTNTMTSNFVP